jgi:ribosome-binding factor A
MLLAALSTPTEAFTISHSTNHFLSTGANTCSSSQLKMAYGRAVSNRDRSKRQERVGHVVRTEIASIIQLGFQIKRPQGFIDDELRRRINVVNADVSPDLRQARITISIMKPSKNGSAMENIELELEDDEESEEDDEESKEDDEESEDSDAESEEDDEEFEEDDDEYMEPKQVFSMNKNADAVVDRRRAYSWLVKNTKQIRHALSQRLKHMKSIPNLTFVQADVGAAVDVMNLIEKVSQGDYKRESLGVFGADDDNLPEGMYLESELEGDGWIDDDFEDFDDVEEEEEGEEEDEDNTED